ncbi:hypothetical protein HGO34_15975 [Agrobacterium vitis]|uniref:Uncharacterized protein n=1 Tax=Agrobacterium vitis TaxID=373 RepID=A0AAE4WCM3_AGRVI|nr:hypothetical protein [Agrobacterium vitis]MCF1498878.1 hypothetical protein [Allorhizobium sp. Av2]MCM2441220.1 hypothetical protein [Agrobacterium vitis]MUZ58396.1 hypothetical protein [Agrobacterium vitis]MVA65910.1 hypothetical protein [Agrobacterium vitis]MVA88068.1 hypothetical protein [Agrobacterium vitis]
MKYVLPILLATAMPAMAQSPQLEQACHTVLQNFLMKPDVKIGQTQSFPELTPPGARITFSERQDADASKMDDVIDCEFQKATAPFGLTKFCISSTCYSPGERADDRRRRFEEMQALMNRK